MDILLSNNSDKPIYQQLEEEIKSQILTNKLPEGSLLPSIRVLAKELKISVITTKRAYEELEKAGFIYTIAGKGSYVNTRNADFILEEYFKNIEEKMEEIVEISNFTGTSLDELIELLTITYQER